MKPKDLEKVEEKKEAKPQWKFRVSQAKTWQKCILEASICRFEHNYRKYFRIIETLISNMFEKERTQIREYAKTLNTDDVYEYYNAVFEKSIDILRDYLMVEHINEEELYKIGMLEESVLDEGDGEIG